MRTSLIENTQFILNLEPANARSFLPCLDEPSFKAVFHLSVCVGHAKHTAISNSLIELTRLDNSSRWIQFEDSPLMSTYLLTLVIGKFEEVVNQEQGTLVRGYCPIGFGNSIKNFVQLAAESVKFYENYFGLPYPLKKLDLVACHRLSVRAMENWGCITFLRDVLLTDPSQQPSQLY